MSERFGGAPPSPSFRESVPRPSAKVDDDDGMSEEVVEDEWTAEDEDRWQKERAEYDREQQERDDEEDWAMLEPEERLEMYWEDAGAWWLGPADRIAASVADVMEHMAETHSTLDREHLVQALQRVVNDVSTFRFQAPVPPDLLGKVAWARTERVEDQEEYSDAGYRTHLYILGIPVGTAATDAYGMPGYVSMDTLGLSRALERLFGSLK